MTQYDRSAVHICIQVSAEAVVRSGVVTRTDSFDSFDDVLSMCHKCTFQGSYDRRHANFH